MKKLKSEKIMLKEVTQQLWRMFDILSGEISPDKYHFVLFILSLYKDGYLDDVISSTPELAKSKLRQSVKEIEKSNFVLYPSIFNNYEPVLDRISQQGIFSLVKAISLIDIEVLSNNYGEIFDSILYHISKAQGRYAGEYILPIEISRLVCSLTDLPKNASIYNPFAGLASFRIFMDDNHNYFGQEINEDTWALGALRIDAHNKSINTNFVKDDSIDHWPSANSKFDLIVANPPYGMRLHPKYRDEYQGIRTLEQFFIQKGVSSLSNEGKLIAVLPQGFLFRGGSEQRLRKSLIESDLIEMVISLPGGLLMNTGIPLAILVINKAKKSAGKISFIDATKFVGVRDSRDKILNDDALYSVVNINKESDSLRITSIERIRDFDYNLNVPRYFQKEYEGVKLSDILETIRGSRDSLPVKGKFVRIRDLKDDKLDYQLDMSLIKDTDLKGYTIKIEESCLLLAKRWKSLKPTYFNYNGNPIYISPDIIALKIDTKKVEIGFLINELYTDYINEQLKAYRVGDVIPNIRREDLLNIKVNLIPIEQQKSKVEGLQELSRKIKNLEQERNALAHGISNTKFNEIASLKHTLGAPRQNILSASKSLVSFFEKNQMDSYKELDKSFSDHYSKSLIEVCKRIKHDINYISEILEKGESGLILKKHPLTVISLYEINKIILDQPDSDFNFTLKKYIIKGDKLKERGIDSNLTLLKVLLDNVLSNANKHGFEDKIKTNEVVIDLKVIEDNLIIEIKNNGRPFPKNFDKNKFSIKHSTAGSDKGSGLGGYDINRIAEYLGDKDWKLILNDDTIYPVKFKFQFMLKSIK